jgi:CP family cyanate transporter-like MFS transporter
VTDKHAPAFPASLPTTLGLLWLAGLSMRLTLLAVPPVIPLIHHDLSMTQAQVGLLVGLPVLVFAIAAVPGSLLIARFGTLRVLTVGMMIAALAGGARGGAASLWQLYALTLLMGFGIAIMQPAVPALVREWLPRRIALGIATSTNGMLAAVMLATALTYPVMLPLVGGSWRLNLVAWAAPVLAAVLLFLAVAPRGGAADAVEGAQGRWWPDWTNPLTWLLGLTFGSNNAAYYGANAFLPDLLAGQGRSDLVGAALGWLNGGQFAASFVLLVLAKRLQQRALPYLLFGPLTIVAFAGMVMMSGYWIVFWSAVMGFASAITFAVILALPPALSAPGDVSRTAAGMFTISYSCAVAIPTISGALWDATGLPWTAFVPLSLCAVMLTVLGCVLSGYRGGR